MALFSACVAVKMSNTKDMDASMNAATHRTNQISQDATAHRPFRVRVKKAQWYAPAGRAATQAGEGGSDHGGLAANKPRLPALCMC
jgi:hypothetical protein